MKVDDLRTIFSDLKTGIINGDTRYEVLDSVHVLDTLTGLKYHLYPHWEHKPPIITKGQKTVLHGMQLTQEEGRMLDSIREMLARHFRELDRKTFFEMHKADEVDHSVESISLDKLNHKPA